MTDRQVDAGHTTNVPGVGADLAGLAGAAGVDLDVLDLVDPRTFADHDLTAFWRVLRRHRPVHWHPARSGRAGFWVLSRHADIEAVYRDGARFASGNGNVLLTLLGGGDPAGGRMLAVSDGARHRRMRTLLLRAFSPRALARVEDGIRDNARRLVADATAAGECDFAADVAGRIPMATICDLLGVPSEDRDHLLQLTKSTISSDHADGYDDETTLARQELLVYFAGLVAERRATPRDDVISVLTASEVDGESLEDEEIVLNCYSLILGGDETSRLSMIDAVLALHRHPDQWHRLRDGDVPLDSAVEEVLRWATPTMHFGRTAVEDVRIADVTIRAGDVVSLWNTSANRDEDVFADPGRFDLARTPNRHLSFGYGPHFCIGAHLARVEIREVLDALRSTVVEFEVTGPVRRIYSNVVTGVGSLPTRFENR